MQPSMDSALEAISTGLVRLGRSTTAGLLRPGRAPGETSAAMAERGLSPSDELVRLYAWHDGTATPPSRLLDDMHLFPGFYFATFDEALANHDAFAEDPRWRRDWLPVFANGGGDFLAISCSADGDRGQVVHFRIDEPEHPVEFRSVAAMLETVAAAYSEDVFFVDDDGYLEMDDDVFAGLAGRLNPDVAWWQE